MKRILAITLMMVLILTGIAAADAPFKVSVELEDSASTYSTDLIVSAGNEIRVNMADTAVAITVDGLSEDGLNFTLDQNMESHENGQKYEIGAFLLPEGQTIALTLTGMESPVLTISWEQLTLDPAFEEVITKVTDILSGNGSDAEDSDLSVIYRMAGPAGLQTMGFAVRDLDNNGVPELFIGENIPGGTETVFYDMFTLAEGELIHVFDGWDRSRYYISENGGIIHKGSNSAFDSFTAYLYFADGELHLMGSVLYNEIIDAGAPWYFSANSEAQVDETAEHVDENDALAFMGQYPASYVELEPFTK